MSERIRTEKWWLSRGSESCPVCFHRYVYEMEVRCTACDGPLCSQCAVTVWETHERFCPGCQEDGQVEERTKMEAGTSL
ncbi:MAG: hypothetical protein WEB88_14795 [Gemmatimonadota bacterium]